MFCTETSCTEIYIYLLPSHLFSLEIDFLQEKNQGSNVKATAKSHPKENATSPKGKFILCSTKCHLKTQSGIYIYIYIYNIYIYIYNTYI